MDFHHSHLELPTQFSSIGLNTNNTTLTHMSHSPPLARNNWSGPESHNTTRASAPAENLLTHTSTGTVKEERVLFAPSQFSLQSNSPEKQNSREDRDLHSQVPSDFFENLNKNTHRLQELMKKLELQVPPTIDFSDHTSPLSDLSPDIRSNCSISQETSELSEKFLERPEECEPVLPIQSIELQN